MDKMQKSSTVELRDIPRDARCIFISRNNKKICIGTRVSEDQIMVVLRCSLIEQLPAYNTFFGSGRGCQWKAVDLLARG